MLGLCCMLAGSAVLAAQGPASLLAEGQKLLRAGDLTGAQARFEQAVAEDPKSYDAHYALGRVLDLNGQYALARKHFEDALALASDTDREQPTTAIAVSYAFEGRPDEAAKYYQRVFDAQSAAERFDGAAAAANAIARVYLEAGNLEKAAEWYATGRETAKQIGKMKAEEIDLWEFRWQHAQARLAARRGDPAGAREHMRQARRILDKGTNEDQKIQWPYLSGYVAFHSGDYATAVKELQAGDQKDPFILGLIAQAYDRLGQKNRAREYFLKVLATPAHTINAAYSWPRAKEYLGRLGQPVR